MTLQGLGVDAGTMRFDAVKIIQTNQVVVELAWYGSPGDPARSRVIFVPLEEFEREVAEAVEKVRVLEEQAWREFLLEKGDVVNKEADCELGRLVRRMPRAEAKKGEGR